MIIRRATHAAMLVTLIAGTSALAEQPASDQTLDLGWGETISLPGQLAIAPCPASTIQVILGNDAPNTRTEGVNCFTALEPAGQDTDPWADAIEARGWSAYRATDSMVGYQRGDRTLALVGVTRDMPPASGYARQSIAFILVGADCDPSVEICETGVSSKES